MAEGIKADWLKGLKVTGSDAKTVKADGRERVKHVPFERDMRVKDVVDFKEYEDRVVLVAMDGRKHVVPLTAKAAASGKADETKK